MWSFQAGDTKLEIVLPKNQHTQWRLLNFENWVNPKQCGLFGQLLQFFCANLSRKVKKGYLDQYSVPSIHQSLYVFEKIHKKYITMTPNDHQAGVMC